MDSITDTNTATTFVDKPFEETAGGFYDENGFYFTLNGSFWDDNGVYFCKYGHDKHFGFYDTTGFYQPGADWNEEFGCYNDEIADMDQVKDFEKDFCNELVREYSEKYEYYQPFFEEESNSDNGTEEINEASSYTGTGFNSGAVSTQKQTVQTKILDKSPNQMTINAMNNNIDSENFNAMNYYNTNFNNSSN